MAHYRRRLEERALEDQWVSAEGVCQIDALWKITRFDVNSSGGYRAPIWLVLEDYSQEVFRQLPVVRPLWIFVPICWIENFFQEAVEIGNSSFANLLPCPLLGREPFVLRMDAAFFTGQRRGYVYLIRCIGRPDEPGGCGSQHDKCRYGKHGNE